MHTVSLFDQCGNEMGKIRQDWFRLPDFIQIEDHLFQRQGKLGAYFYTYISPVIVGPECEVLWKE